MTETDPKPGPEAAETPDAAGLEFLVSPGFTDWLTDQNISLALTSYRSGKLFLIGRQTDRRLSVFERTFARCMGLWADGQSVWVATLFEMWKFQNIIPPGQIHGGYDACYVPRACHVTGDLNVHDVALDHDGRVVFVNTLFNCLATVSDNHSFRELWRPPFVKRLVPQDHCHLNGMAMETGRPRYASMFAQCDEFDGWRKHRLTGGSVIDLQTNEFVVEGLAMPHSPRLYRGRLWLLQSGIGEFGYVDLSARKFVPVTFCPGYVRGLAFVGDYAVVGMSKGREENLFQELPLHQHLHDRGMEVCCGLSIVDLRSGQIVHSLRIHGLVTQMYDVSVLPGIVRPMAIGFKTDEVQRMISIDPSGSLPA